MHTNNIGIEAIGCAIPSLAMHLTELNQNNNPNSLMALCSKEEDVVTLAISAAKKALTYWVETSNIVASKSIGMVVVATETAVDMSRPLSAWVMQELGLQGNIRSYEVKHACLGGTIAMKQAYEWLYTNNDPSKVALVVSADVALYEPQHSGEITQGAGSVAFILGHSPIICNINPKSFAWSTPAFDFWRPVNVKYPLVNGRLTLSCYNNAVINCFSQLADSVGVTVDNLLNYLNENFAAIAFHVPFVKMVETSFKNMTKKFNWDKTLSDDVFTNKVLPTLTWSQLIGNSYTASLWFAVARSLTYTKANDNIIAFSFGSGCGAELLTLQCINNQQNSQWQDDLQQELQSRTIIGYQDYCNLRDIKQLTTIGS